MNQEVLTERTGYVNESMLEGKSVRPGCLGQLRGPICEWRNPTRNDHYYTQSLWQRVFNLPWVKEAMKTRTLFGEADHPEDRLESTLSKTAVVLVDYQERPEEMDYIGTFDILDTPSGRIVRTLAEYGCELGVSSRGRGSLTKINGRNTVDENSYVFGGFDIVALPAVKKARHQFIGESVQFKSVKNDLQNQINECQSIDELNIMKSILENSDYVDLVETINGKISGLSESISRSADNTIVDGLTKDLRDAYAKIEKLESAQSNTIGNSKDQIVDAQLLISTLSENSKFASQIGDLKVEVHKLQSENDRLVQQLTETTHNINSTDLNSVYDINDTTDINNQLVIDQLLSDNQRLQETVDYLKTVVKDNAVREKFVSTDSRATILELQKTVRSKTAEVNNLVEELDDVHYVNKELSNEFDKLNESYKRTSNKLAAIVGRHNKLIEMLENAEYDDEQADNLEDYYESLKLVLSKSRNYLKRFGDNLQDMSRDSLRINSTSLAEKLADTEDELSEVYETLDNLRGKYDKAVKYISNMRHNYSAVRESISDFHKESSDVLTELRSSYEEALSDLDYEKATRRQLANRYNDVIDDYKSQIDDVSNELSDSNRDLKSTQRKLNHIQKDLVDAHSELDSTYSELKQTQVELKKAHKELNCAHDELDSTYSELDKTQHKLSSTSEELKQMHEELTKTQGELESVQSKLNVTRSALQTTRDELVMSQEELSEATSDLSDTQNELSKANREIGRHKKIIKRLADDKGLLENELAQTQQEADKIQQHLVNSHNNEIDSYEDEIEQLNTELADVTEQMDTYKTKYKSLVESHRDLKLKYDKAVAELLDIRSDYNETVIENEKMLNRVSSRYNRVKQELNERVQYIKRLESELQKVNQSSSAVQAELKESLDVSNSDIEQLQNDYDELSSDYNSLLEENAVLRLSYLGQQANRIGVSSTDLVNMLPKKFSVKDIDAVVESHLSRKKRESNLSITSPKVNLNSSQQLTLKTKIKPVNEDLSSTQKTLQALQAAKK